MNPKRVKSPRADSLIKIRDLVFIGVEHNESDRKSLGELAKANGLFVTRKTGAAYSHSSEYRYYASLLFLGFDKADSIEGPIVWSQHARELADAARETAFTNTLSHREKRVLCDQMFSSEILREGFLAHFCPAKMIPRNRHMFAQECRPLYVLRIFNQDRQRLGPPTQRSKDLYVEFSLDPDSNNNAPKPAMEFLYTYRLWCLDAGVIEEINVKEAQRWGIPRKRAHVLFPTRDMPAPSVDEFIEELYRFAGHSRRPISIPMVQLLYGLCVDLRITVEAFKQLLVEARDQNPELIHFERAPGVLIQGEFKAADRDHSDRFGNHRYYVILDGTIRSAIFLFPRK